LRSHSFGEAELKKEGGLKSSHPGKATQGIVSGCPKRGQFVGDTFQAAVYFK